MDFLEKIDEILEAKEAPPRTYLGASIIGHDCSRQIWYTFNAPKSYPARVQRIFDAGHALEKTVKEWLEKAGMMVPFTPETLASVEVPHLKGHIDCLVKYNNTVYVCDIKTMKHSEFNRFKRSDDLKSYSFHYYSQLIVYMGIMNIRFGMLLALDKDTMELSYKTIRFDEIMYDALTAKAERIINSVEPPPRINNSPLWYQCQMCNYKKICHENPETLSKAGTG